MTKKVTPIQKKAIATLLGILLLAVPLAVTAGGEWVYSTVEPEVVWLQRVEQTEEGPVMVLRVRWDIEPTKLGEISGFRYKEETLRLPFPEGLTSTKDLEDWFEDNIDRLMRQARGLSLKLEVAPIETLRSAATTGVQRGGGGTNPARGIPREASLIAEVVGSNLTLRRPLEVRETSGPVARRLSFRTFITEELRTKINAGTLQPGDFVLVQFVDGRDWPIATNKVFRSWTGAGVPRK